MNTQRYIIETPLGLVKFEPLYPNLDWIWLGGQIQISRVENIFGKEWLDDLDSILQSDSYKNSLSLSVPGIYLIYKKAKLMISKGASPEVIELKKKCSQILKLSLMEEGEDYDGIYVPTANVNKNHYYSSGSYNYQDVIDKTEKYLSVVPRIKEYKKIHEEIKELLIKIGVNLEAPIFNEEDYPKKSLELDKEHGLDGVTFNFILAEGRLNQMTKFLDVSDKKYFTKYMGTSEELQFNNAVGQVLNHHKNSWLAVATIKQDFYFHEEEKKDHISFITKGNRDRGFNLSSDLSSAYQFNNIKEITSILDRADLEFTKNDLLILEAQEQKIVKCYPLEFDEKTNPKLINFMDSVNANLLKREIENEIGEIGTVSNSAIKPELANTAQIEISAKGASEGETIPELQTNNSDGKVHKKIKI